MNINKQIVNRALDKAGEEPITEAEWEAGTGTRVRLVKDYYLSTILETLSNTAWTSRKKRAVLEKSEGNLTDYANIYLLPPDCAKPVEISEKAEFITEGKFLYTDAENPTLLYISNGWTGEYKYKEVSPQPTEQTFISMKYYYLDEETETYILAETFQEDTTYYEIEHEDYDLYEDIDFDPLLSEYIETRLAAKMVLKLTGNQQLYQLLYNESTLMENRAVKASVAHGYNKDKGNLYWGQIMGLPEYE